MRPAIYAGPEVGGSLACWRGDCARCPGSGPAVVKRGVVVAKAWTCTHRCHAPGSS